MAQNDSFDILEKWRGGVEFCFAWHRLADPYALQKYRNTTTRGALEAEQMMMVAELWAGLRDGEFEAFGKCVAPEISNGPVLIPAHTFEFQPPRGIGDSNDFEISGWRYEGVKVVRIREIDADAVEHERESDFESIAEATLPVELFAVEIPAKSAEDIPPPQPEPAERDGPASKRGDRAAKNYTDARMIIAELFEESPAYRSAAAQRLLAAFNTRYIDRYSTVDIKRGPISERSLRSYLAMYRQELAKIGSE